MEYKTTSHFNALQNEKCVGENEINTEKNKKRDKAYSASASNYTKEMVDWAYSNISVIGTTAYLIKKMSAKVKKDA